MSHTPNFGRVMQAINRCYNPAHVGFKNYGARGITIYGPWMEDPLLFVAYLDGLGPCPEGWSMDRIDNDGNYEPGNIRWASARQQHRNRRHN
jgi:hypothetical protein